MKLTYWLILIAVAVFIFTVSAPDPDAVYSQYGFSGQNLLARPYTAVTSIFLHGSLVHLLSNVFVWIFFGAAVEEELGKGRMLTIFLLGAVAGEALSLMFYPFAEISIGASAAIFALVGVGMLVRPMDLSFYPLLVPLPLALIGLFFAVFNTYQFLFAPDPAVSYIGHFGGLAVGLIFGFKYGGVKRGLKIIVVAAAIMIIVPLIYLLLTR